MDRMRVCRMCGELFPVNAVDKHEKICQERPRNIYVNAKPPSGFKKIVASEIPVAGLYIYEKNILKFIKGAEHSIILEREADNEFDKNAIKVLAIWREGDTEKCEMAGYVPKNISAKIANHSEKAIVGCLKFIRLPKKGTEECLRVEPQIFYDIYMEG